MRVVSLLPSATEILFALGVEPIAVSHECDYPAAARDLPSIIESRVDPDESSARINEQVAEAERSGGVYTIDRGLFADLDPDLAIAQGICDVCAVDTVQVEAVIKDLGLDCDLVTTDPHRLADLYGDIERIGRATGTGDRASALVDTLRGRVDRVANAVEATESRPPRVAVLDWIDPVMVAGHWMPELVHIAGGNYGLAAPGERSRPQEWREIRAYDPELLVIAPCGFDLEQTRGNVDDLTDRVGYDEITAVRAGRVYLMDGHQYVNRPGPRLVETLEFLAGLLHPDRFEAPPADAVQGLLPNRA